MKSKIIASALVFSLVLALAACSAAPAASPSPSPSTAAPTFTVTFYDGDAVLKTESVESGKTVSEYTPVKDGSEFVGWFATPSKSHTFDFSAPITADVGVYAGFSENIEDTRSFAIVGSGKSRLLLSSDWGKVINDEHRLTKTPGKNEYTITCDILEADQFQFAVDSSWTDQHGYGFLAANKDASGAEVFTGGGGIGDAADNKKNITCAVAGNYTFTLTTSPSDDAFDKIEWVRNSDPVDAAIEILTTYYIKGETITAWGDVYDDTTGMVKDGDLNTLTVTLVAGDKFLFTSQVTANGETSTGSEYVKYGNLDEAGRALFTDDNGNIAVTAAGTYTFVYNSATTVLTAALA
ncbi:hypothetical protein FACS1894202_10650 [Clostridia bacterium]|nr:hypothetical protein FACS1894202_10650 [Clostridia bacterium]